MASGSDDRRYGSMRWRRLRLAVIARDGRRCSVAGCTSDMTRPKETHVDHVVEVRDGGPFWDLANLRVVCRRHHMAKTLSVAAGRDERRSPNA